MFLPAFRPGSAFNETKEESMRATADSIHSCTALVYYETDMFVAQMSEAVRVIRDMNLAQDRGRIEIRLVDWVKFDGSAPMVFSEGDSAEDVYLKNYQAYESPDHCVVIVESPPVFPGTATTTTLGMASVCTYCWKEEGANVAFVTNDNLDTLTHVTIAHEIGHLLCGVHTDSFGVMYETIGAGENYDVFSKESAEEMSQDLSLTNFGGDSCMAEFNGSSTLPHNEYMCNQDGYCYKSDHSHADGAVFFLFLFFGYFVLLSSVLFWPYEYVYKGYRIAKDVE